MAAKNRNRLVGSPTATMAAVGPNPNCGLPPVNSKTEPIIIWSRSVHVVRVRIMGENVRGEQEMHACSAYFHFMFHVLEMNLIAHMHYTCTTHMHALTCRHDAQDHGRSQQDGRRQCNGVLCVCFDGFSWLCLGDIHCRRLNRRGWSWSGIFNNRSSCRLFLLFCWLLVGHEESSSKRWWSADNKGCSWNHGREGGNVGNNYQQESQQEGIFWRRWHDERHFGVSVGSSTTTTTRMKNEDRRACHWMVEVEVERSESEKTAGTKPDP